MTTGKTKGKVRLTKAKAGESKEVAKPNDVVAYLDTVKMVDKPAGKEIVALLNDFYPVFEEWRDQVDNIIVTDESHTAEMELARAGRIALKNKRVALEKAITKQRKLVQDQMADIKLVDTTWLKVWQLMEANFKNLEGKLQEKEEFTERKETARKLQLRVERIDKMQAIGAPIDAYRFDEMEDETFNAIYDSAVQAKVDREKVAELERVEAERQKELAAKAIELEKENAKLKVRSEALEEIVKIGQETGQYDSPITNPLISQDEHLSDKQKLLNFAEMIEDLDYELNLEDPKAQSILDYIIDTMEIMVDVIRKRSNELK